jgi:Arc/MetJ-type ribon-helix-helix transcriptional regulator
MPTNAIKLPAALEKFVASQVRDGTYRSREAAIVAAVSQQKRRSEQLAWLQSEVQKRLSVAVAADLRLAPVGLGADASSNRTRTTTIWFSIASDPASSRSSA